MLPDQNGEQAVNADLNPGILLGLPCPELIIDLSSKVPVPQRAYRYPADANGTGADVWLPLPSPYSSVVRSPEANDASKRLYWTNPNDPGSPYFSTALDIAQGAPPYNVGMTYPDPTQPVIHVVPVGGTTDGSVPLEARSYCFTYGNAFNEESAPSMPTPPVEGPPDATWMIYGLPQTPPPSPAGKNYPAIDTVLIYRTATGQNTGGQFFLTDFYSFVPSVGRPPGPDPRPDPTPDEQIAANSQLISGSFANPVPGLDGIIALPGGMLAGFTDSTVHFCEPNRPHAWPAAYDQSMQYPIKGFGVWQQSLVVLTEGFPSTGSGPNPSNFIFTQVRVPEPCIARGSIVTDLLGVYYASQNGVVMLNYFGMQNQTMSMMSKNIWLTQYHAANIIACRHRSQYLAINGTGTGFLIDYSEQRMGIMPIDPMKDAVCVWNDEYTGDAYIISNGIVYRWDSPNTPRMSYRWRSKQFYTPAPISLAALQISLDPEVATVIPPESPPMCNDDPGMALPSGVNAICNVFAGPDGQYLIATRNLMTSRELFRVPSGFKAFGWQVEVISRVGIRSIELATSMKELRGV